MERLSCSKVSDYRALTRVDSEEWGPQKDPPVGSPYHLVPECPDPLSWKAKLP